MLLLMLLVSFFFTLMAIFWVTPKLEESLRHRNDWGAADAKPGLVTLQLPVERIIVTDTRDEAGSCSTEVKSDIDPNS